MSVLSIQSTVSYGHVGNAAAVFALQRLGLDVWPVHTVQFSNHPGHGHFAGGALGGDHVAGILGGLARLGVLGRCRAVLSGYLGEGASADAVAYALDRVGADTPYACDPVLGDAETGLYVPDAVVAAMHRLAGRATILTPNTFELSVLSGMAVDERGRLMAAARRLLETAQVVVATSVRLADTLPGMVETVAVTRTGAWRVVTPWLDLKAKGTGDAFTALFLGHWLTCEGDVERALTRASSALHAVIAATVAEDGDELLLVPSQDALRSPPLLFPAEALGVQA